MVTAGEWTDKAGVWFAANVTPELGLVCGKPHSRVRFGLQRTSPPQASVVQAVPPGVVPFRLVLQDVGRSLEELDGWDVVEACVSDTYGPTAAHLESPKQESEFRECYSLKQG